MLSWKTKNIRTSFLPSVWPHSATSSLKRRQQSCSSQHRNTSWKGGMGNVSSGRTGNPTDEKAVAQDASLGRVLTYVCTRKLLEESLMGRTKAPFREVERWGPREGGRMHAGETERPLSLPPPLLSRFPHSVVFRGLRSYQSEGPGRRAMWSVQLAA